MVRHDDAGAAPRHVVIAVNFTAQQQFGNKHK
jgi:hypothetical protein